MKEKKKGVYKERKKERRHEKRTNESTNKRIKVRTNERRKQRKKNTKGYKIKEKPEKEDRRMMGEKWDK